MEMLTIVRLKDLVELLGLLTDHMEPPVSSPQSDICPAVGQGLEYKSGTISNIRSTLPLSRREGCQTDSLCPSLHTLEFIECHCVCSQFSILLDKTVALSSLRKSRPCPSPSLTPPRLYPLRHGFLQFATSGYRAIVLLSHLAPETWKN